jgi:hypothetical protein
MAIQKVRAPVRLPAGACAARARHLRRPDEDHCGNLPAAVAAARGARLRAIASGSAHDCEPDYPDYLLRAPLPTTWRPVARRLSSAAVAFADVMPDASISAITVAISLAPSARAPCPSIEAGRLR